MRKAVMADQGGTEHQACLDLVVSLVALVSQDPEVLLEIEVLLERLVCRDVQVLQDPKAGLDPKGIEELQGSEEKLEEKVMWVIGESGVSLDQQDVMVSQDYQVQQDQQDSLELLDPGAAWVLQESWDAMAYQGKRVSVVLTVGLDCLEAQGSKVVLEHRVLEVLREDPADRDQLAEDFQDAQVHEGLMGSLGLGVR